MIGVGPAIGRRWTEHGVWAPHAGPSKFETPDRVKLLAAGVGWRTPTGWQHWRYVPHPFQPDEWVWQLASTVSELTTGDASSEAVTTASIDPADNSAVLVFGYVVLEGGGTPGALTVSNGGIADWATARSGTNFSDGSSFTGRLDVVRGMSASTTGPAAATLDWAGTDHDYYVYKIVETDEVTSTGTAGADAVLQSDEGTVSNGTALNADLGVFGNDTDNVCIMGIAAGSGGPVITIGEGGGPSYTSFGDEAGGGFDEYTLDVGYTTGEDRTPGGTLSAAAYGSVIALELENAAVAAAADGYGVVRGHAYGAGLGEKSGEASGVTRGAPHALVLGEKVAEGFAIARAAAHLLGEGEKSGLAEGHGFVFSPSLLLAEGQKGGEVSAALREAAELLAAGEKAGEATAIIFGPSSSSAEGEKSGEGEFVGLDAGRLLVFGQKDGEASGLFADHPALLAHGQKVGQAEGYAQVFGPSRLIVEGEKLGEAYLLSWVGATTSGHGQKDGESEALVHAHPRLLVLGEKVGATIGYGYMFNPSRVIALGEKDGQTYPVAHGLAYLLSDSSTLVVLFPVGDRVGRAIYDPIFGKAKQE